MTAIKARVSFVCASALGLLLALGSSACGGKDFHQESASPGGTGGTSNAGSGGTAGGELCGGTLCGADQRCCGPAECGHCISKLSGQMCPVSCAGSGGSSGTGGSAGVGGGTAGTGGACATCTGRGLNCCGDACRNLGNDPKNCGTCGTVCQTGQMCAGGSCVIPACTAELCPPTSVCCGSVCCASGQLCCQSSGGPAPVGTDGFCADPVDGTCPVGCPLCICAAPDTPISTPSGEVPIAALKPGDLVYSLGAKGVVVVPVLRINRAAVSHHTMVRLSLANGATLELSPRHPTADGRQIGSLGVGERIDGVAIVAIERVPYEQPYTYDILADSASGAYFAGGVLMGSTLRERP